MAQRRADEQEDVLLPYPAIRRHLEELERRGAYFWDDVILGPGSVNPLTREPTELEIH